MAQEGRKPGEDPSSSEQASVTARHLSREVSAVQRSGVRAAAAGCCSSIATVDVEAQHQPLPASTLNVVGSRPSLENRGFARAMMKQMPSKLALSASKIANLSYGRQDSDTHPKGQLTIPLEGHTSSVRSAPSLVRYEKDVGRLVEMIEIEIEAQGKSLLTEDRKNTRLRQLPVSLTTKRLVRQRLDQNLAERRLSQPQTRLTRLSAQLGRGLVLTKRYLADAHDLVHIWHEQLKNIEGNFGQNVGLYFRFMRWLLVVNLQLFLISVLFLVVPQILLGAVDPDEADRSSQGMREPHRGRLAALARREDPFSPSDLITGQGWLLNTAMYYGRYYRGTIRLVAGGGYYMPAAYLYITGVCITLQLAMLAVSTARSYRKNFIDVSTDTSGNIANLILAGWDARVTSPLLAEIKRGGLYSSFKKKLEKKEAEQEARQQPVSWAATAARRRQRLLTVLGRLGVNLVVMVTLVGIANLTWLVMQLDEGKNTLSLVASALLISVSMAVFPLLFQLLGSLEKLGRHERALIFITLIRMVLMVIIIIGTIVTYWVTRINAMEQADPGSTRHSEKWCWEDEVGSELYQLMVSDLLFTIVVESGLEYARKVANRYGVTMLGEPHFDIPRSTTFLIYNQTLVWAGGYFSPMLSLLGSCKLVITFYVRKWSLWHNCQPQARSVRASQTQTVFRLVAFSVCFLAASFTGYIVFNVKPSISCGPFQGRVAPWVIFNDTLNNWRDEGHAVLYGLLTFSTRPGVVAVWILAFSVCAYYMRSLAHARQEMIELLRGQLTLEGQDKVVLLQMIDDAAAKLEEVRRRRHDQETQKKEVEDEPIMFEAPKDMQILLEPQSSRESNSADEEEEEEKPSNQQHAKADQTRHKLLGHTGKGRQVRIPDRLAVNFWSRYGAHRRHRHSRSPRRSRPHK